MAVTSIHLYRKEEAVWVTVSSLLHLYSGRRTQCTKCFWIRRLLRAPEIAQIAPTPHHRRCSNSYALSTVAICIPPHPPHPRCNSNNGRKLISEHERARFSNHPQTECKQRAIYIVAVPVMASIQASTESRDCNLTTEFNSKKKSAGNIYRA